ncbi:hypothetical protein D3C87_1825980 [compost metagenome]
MTGTHVPLVGTGCRVVVALDFRLDIVVGARPVLARFGVRTPRLGVVRHAVDTVSQGCLDADARRPVVLGVIDRVRTPTQVATTERPTEDVRVGGIGIQNIL